MNLRRSLPVLALVVVAAAGALLLYRGGPDTVRDAPAPRADEPAPRAAPRRADEPTAPAVPADQAAPPRPTDAGIADLAARLAASDEDGVRAAAVELHRRMRTDAAAWDAVAATLLDPATPEALREALAFVVGTVDSEKTDALLLGALSRFGSTPEFARAALLALGAKRTPPEEDDVFRMGDRPWGADGPCGLGITVRRPIDDRSTRAVLAARLADAAVPARWAAATSLRHSLGADDARAAFLGALKTESADDVAAVLGESLASRARASSDADERAALLASLLARAGEPSFEGYRFRMENDLHGLPLAAERRAALTELTGASHDFGVRSFALQILAETAEASGGDAVRDTRRLLAGLVTSDLEAPVRDLSARLLRSVPADDESLAALATAARKDVAWNVRHAAIETYAKVATPAQSRALLEAAAGDLDERVRARAAELLKTTTAPPR